MRVKILLVCSLLFFISSQAQVQLQSGAPQYSIPLYSYSDPGNRLAASVSLSYVAGNGIKATDVASCVGTGWSLNFGGVITRTQRGEPDDQKQYVNYPDTYPGSAGYGNYLNNYYPDGYLYSAYNPETPVDAKAAYTPLFPSSYALPYKQMPEYIADREQDQFSFSFLGQQGVFVIGKDGSIKSLTDSKLKFEMTSSDMISNNIITRIAEFRIIDPSGIKYTFKDLELNEVMEGQRDGGLLGIVKIVNGSNATSDMSLNIYRDSPKNLFVVNKWFLSEIENPRTNVKIKFNYTQYDFDMIGTKSFYESRSESKSDMTLQVQRIKGKAKRLTSIKFSDKDELTFNYSAEGRNDLPFDKMLESVYIQSGTELKYYWELKYGYFVKDQIRPRTDILSAGEKLRSRLCLLSLQQKASGGALAVPPYLFQYNIGNYTYSSNGTTYTSQLELFPAFTFYQDKWGYGSSATWSSTSLDELGTSMDYSNINWIEMRNYVRNSYNVRDPSNNYPVAGMLKTIRNPQGGGTDF